VNLYTHKDEIWPQETRNIARSIVWGKMCFDILNRSGVVDECDGQTDERT